MRYSIDDGSTWQTLPQGGGTTEKISFPTEWEKVVKFIVQIMDDKTFYENEQAGLDGFGAGELNTFTFWVEQVPPAEHSADIISAEVDQGYLSPEYDPQITARDYHATVAAGEAAPVLTFEISPDATVKIDNQEQTPVEGTYNKYIFTIPEVVKRIEVISADGKLIEGINVNVGGNNRKLTSKDGKNYEITVGHRIGEVVINPVVNPQAALTINGEAKQGSYELTYGDNEFTIAATDANGNSETVKLVVKRDNPPASSGKKINVKFTVYGDGKHGNNGIVHAYSKNKADMPVWIEEKTYSVPAEYAVLDVFEMALKEANLTWVNDGGNYIAEINGLAQFDNGGNSGWMYTLNGSHPNLGVAEQSLKNGDSIVFHYTDDYTLEEDVNKWGSGGSSTDKNVEDDKKQPADENGFTDTTDHWAADAINFVVKQNLFTGTTATTFEPETAMNSAMLVTVLWRLDGKPAANTASGFTADLSGFVDSTKISPYAVDNLKWAKAAGILNGRTETALVPQGDSTRAEVATMIQRFVSNIMK